MNLVSPFRTHLETVKERDSILVKVTDEHNIHGWGEVVAFSSPWYTAETIDTAWHMLEDFFIPVLFKQEWESPKDVAKALAMWRGNEMAKAGLEMAVWDLFARRSNQSLSTYIGGVRDTVKAGVVVGIDNLPAMLQTIEQRAAEGYERIKVKIDPTNDYEMLKSIKHSFPTLDVLADANSAYTLDNIEKLKRIDSLGLLMIEQPLGASDIVEHSILQGQMETPICLDESIVSVQDAKNALYLNSCKTMSIKIGRVGGVTQAIGIHDLCQENNIPVWCGGMLEMGISRAFNIALATLSNFTIPGDISSSDRYWKRDVTFPKVEVKDGEVEVPTSPGIGFEVDEDYIKSITKITKTFTKQNIKAL